MSTDRQPKIFVTRVDWKDTEHTIGVAEAIVELWERPKPRFGQVDDLPTFTLTATKRGWMAVSTESPMYGGYPSPQVGPANPGLGEWYGLVETKAEAESYCESYF